MDFANIIEVFEVICIVLTVIQFLSGLPVCVQMMKERSVENVPFPIFLLASVSCLGMCIYGWRLDNAMIYYLNLLGLVLFTLYVVMYILVVNNKGKYLAAAVSAVAVLAYFYKDFTSGRMSDEEVTHAIGDYSSYVVILLVLLPVPELVNNIRNQNAEGVPLVMLSSQLVTGSSWLVYGLLLNDPIIYRPNLPGLTVTLAKLACFAVFGSPTKTKKE